MLDGRIGLAVAILLVCSLRLAPNMAMDKVLSFALSQRGYSVAQVGWYQSLFLISASAGMFIMAFRFRPGLEKAFMVVCPLAGIPLVYALGLEATPPAMFAALLVLTGLILWGTTPAMVSYAQQLFPQGAGLASAITMGLSWGVGGLIQAPITAYFQSTGHPQQALHALIPCLMIAAAGAYFLPNTRTQTATGELTERRVALEAELVRGEG
jgi:FSR family fosmidomycin resistance protein-like MFS transporter